jgi:peroxin-14
VNFLNNPKVAQSTLIQKRNFLARKGLTEEEIQRAFEKVGIFFNISEMNGNVESPEETIIQVPQPYKYQMTPFEKIKDMVSSAALISGIVYGVYMFYKVRKR